MEYYSAIKKEGNPAICDNMDGPWGHYAKWNKSDKERQILYELTYIWNLKKKNHQTHRYREQTDGCQRWGGGRGGEMGEGGQRYKLPVISLDSMVTIVNNTELYIWKLLRE